MERNPVRLAPELIQRALELGEPIPRRIAHFAGFMNHLIGASSPPAETTPASITYYGAPPEQPPRPPVEPALPPGLRFKDPNHRELGFVLDDGEEEDVA